MSQTNSASAAPIELSLNDYDLRVHRVGRVTMALAMCAAFLPVFVPAIVYGVPMDWGNIFRATLAVLAMFGINGLVEPFAFAPILGAGASYIAFTTGNVSQTKVPCVVAAQKIMGVDMGTPEGDVVATLAAGVCSLVTTLEVALGMVFVSIVYGFLTSPVIAPGFNNIVPAVLGAVSVLFIWKSPKVGFLPYVVYAVFLLAVGVAFDRSYGAWCMIALIALTVGWAWVIRDKRVTP